MKQELVIKKKDEIYKGSYKFYPKDKPKQVYCEIIREKNRIIDTCFKGFNKKKKKVLELIYRMEENIKSEWYDIKKYSEK
ncbi:MarR family transcriptional regulator [Clostridium oceanicum]|uniref:Uncharacterized protein n=1 Tax=Clostridium oceanicum TaxID=1543 RepID=A0ABN1JD84_9CLOT